MSTTETRTVVPPDVLEAVSEAVSDWVGENTEDDPGGGRPFWDAVTRFVIESLAEHTQIVAFPLPGETPAAPSAMPPPVADFGPVRLELMGHRYREGNLSEVVIAGQPFLRLEPPGCAAEYYRPDAVYCLTPVTAMPAPRAAIPERFPDLVDDEDFGDHGNDEDGPF